MSVYELSEHEIYSAYSGDYTPQELLRQGRKTLAERVMREGGLAEEEAYYATDQILAHAQSLVDQQSG